MPTIDKIIEELHFLSNRISTQVRMVSVCLIAVTWGLLMGTSSTTVAIAGEIKKHLLLIGFLAILAMFLDFLQYFCGYLDADRLRLRMEEKELRSGEYDYKAPLHRLRHWFFWAKQGVLSLAVVWFLVVVAWYIF